jgi:hypothetical protein
MVGGRTVDDRLGAKGSQVQILSFRRLKELAGSGQTSRSASFLFKVDHVPSSTWSR